MCILIHVCSFTDADQHPDLLSLASPQACQVAIFGLNSSTNNNSNYLQCRGHVRGHEADSPHSAIWFDLFCSFLNPAFIFMLVFSQRQRVVGYSWDPLPKPSLSLSTCDA